MPAAPSLEAQFRDPPASARPRVWWHWMNGNVTKDGIARDMAWMKRIGIAGLQNFDANLGTPQIVEKRLAYMTPEWKDAFRFAAQEADRLGLELAIAASPGWSETGGPWVPPADGLKKVVWSEMTVEGGKRISAPMPPPPQVTGPFLDLPLHEPFADGGATAQPPRPQYYTDIAVLAFPVPGLADVARPTVTTGSGVPLDGRSLDDGSLQSGVELPRGTPEDPASLTFTYPDPRTVRSATLFIPGAKGMFSGATVEPQLFAATSDGQWRKIADLPVSEAPTTVSFAPVVAARFRIVLTPAPFRGSNLGDSAPGAAPPAFLQGLLGAAKAPFRVVQARLSAEPMIDRYEAKAGFAIERDYYALGQPDAETRGVDPATIVNLTGKLRPDGTLDWTPPKGSAWRIVRLGASLLGTTNHPAPPEATGLEVDKFDTAAVTRYLEHYLSTYRDAVGEGMVGPRGVSALLTDSIEVGAANWTPKMVAQFTRLRGYDPTPWFPALAGTIVGTRAESDKFLYDYRRTLAELMSGDHYATVARISHENGLKVYGEALEDNRPSLGDDMSMRSHADVPMAALWTFSRSKGPNPSYLSDMKGASSVAHVYGQNLAAAESMTAAMSPWNFAPADLRRFVDLEFAMGINRPVIHTSVHQPTDDKLPGISLAMFGQYFNRHESWAEMARPWVDYISRSSLLLQAGRNVADVAYFYGEEAPITGLFGQKPVSDAPTANAWDFLSPDALDGALVNDGALLRSQGGALYHAIYLGGSSRHMTLKALRRLSALVEGGGSLIGLPPESSPALADADPVRAAEWAALVRKLWPGTPSAAVGRGRVIATADVDAGLKALAIAPDFVPANAPADAQVLFVHRALGDGELWYLANRKTREERFEGRFRVTGKQPELWHADTGRSEPVSYRIENGITVVPLALPAESSVFVVFRKPATAQAREVRAPAQVPLASITGPWTVTFQPGRGAPASIVLPALQSLETHADPGVKYFSGEMTYSRSFRLPKGYRKGHPLWLDLGAVHDLAEVTVNGKATGGAWHAPYRVDISNAVKAGRNQLSIRIANTWVNRLIGDAQPGVTQKVSWTAEPSYLPDAPLRPSGLVGPVSLATER
ncbi:glycosyl hydrolase [Novosphingobium cyanobacteriorum]|uniref:Glycosyl hydrolase n=1 Tax=Novosphingobium cyanobacteriorum TaxID=3024215 RepID=A0ABT6CJ82_9SPHN|nr:glycosyl hydrolase [Novosphingobium cyanobacteriorum]MDF8333871.1 glycosyl hydrolase [Novosphingobium cyanobacteriorum]